MLSSALAQEKGSAPINPPAAQNAWKPNGSLAVRESFDDNVFLQSVGANANRHSFETTVFPSVGLDYLPSSAFSGSLKYSPEINVFHSATGEDFTLHRVLLGLNGSTGPTKWELGNNFVAIDGSDVGPSYFGPGGSPAAGGPQLRDRRAALVERGQFRLTHTFSDWFVRPVVSGYDHDFRTIQETTPGYQNFVDRSDWNAGADLSHTLPQNTWLVLGYRYGQQTQDKLFDFPEQYDSTYHRALFGLEGKPWSWLNLALSLGPEFRQYASTVPSSVDRAQTYLYADSALTMQPSKADTISVTAKRFEQPGFSGRSACMDSTYELTWRHKFGGRFTVGIGLRAYNTDFLKPVARNDWIVTPSILGAYTFECHLSAEISYIYDDAFSLVPDTQGREYTRNLASLGIKYSF